MSSEAPEDQTPAAPAAVVNAAPTTEAVPKDAPGAPSASNITEGIEKMNLNPPSQQPVPTASIDSTITRSDEKPTEEPSVSKRNLIINYLPPNLTEGNLATLFSPYGALEECKIVIDLETGRSRGYGFVKYANEESAATAKDHLNGYPVENKRLKVAYARKQCKEIQNANLYVTNIPPHYNESQLKLLFAEFGEIIECRILRNDSGQSRGVGFVRLDTHVHAMTALQDRDGYVCEEGAAPLVVKLAQRRKRNNYGNWNHTDGRSLPRQAGGREPTSPGQSGRNPRYSGGMSGRRVGGIGASSFGRDPMNDYPERRRDDRQDRRDVRSSPGFRGRGRGAYGGGFNSGRQHRGRGGPASMGRRLNYRPVRSGPPGVMGGMHGPPNGSMGSGRMQQQPQQYRPSGRGMAGVPPFDSYNNFMNAPSGFYPPPSGPPPLAGGFTQPKSSHNTTAFSLVVKNIPEYYTIDHLIALYAPFGPIHSVNIDQGTGRAESDKPPLGVVTFFYFDDAKKARVETNGRTVDDKELDVAFENAKSQ